MRLKRFSLEFIQSALVSKAKVLLEQYKTNGEGYPDPSFAIQFPDDVYLNSNFYAIQKTFDGPFQFDIIYQNQDTQQTIDCMLHPHQPLSAINIIQLQLLIKVSQRFWRSTMPGSNRSSLTQPISLKTRKIPSRHFQRRSRPTSWVVLVISTAPL